MGFMRVIFVCTIVLVGSASATWCGCQNNGGGCQSCCGTPPDSTPYAKVWEADFSGANVAEQWEIETWDPSGDQASKYVNDGSTIIVSNNSLKLQLVEMKVANGARYKSARLKSKASFQYGLYMVDVVDFNVAGCGMWPAIWMVSAAPTLSSRYRHAFMADTAGRSRRTTDSEAGRTQARSTSSRRSTWQRSAWSRR